MEAWLLSTAMVEYWGQLLSGIMEVDAGYVIIMRYKDQCKQKTVQLNRGVVCLLLIVVVRDVEV